MSTHPPCTAEIFLRGGVIWFDRVGGYSPAVEAGREGSRPNSMLACVKSGAFLRIRADTGFNTHMRVMYGIILKVPHCTLVAVGVHNPQSGRADESSHPDRLSPRTIGVIRTPPCRDRVQHTRAGHVPSHVRDLAPTHDSG